MWHFGSMRNHEYFIHPKFFALSKKHSRMGLRSYGPSIKLTQFALVHRGEFLKIGVDSKNRYPNISHQITI